MISLKDGFEAVRTLKWFYSRFGGHVNLDQETVEMIYKSCCVLDEWMSQEFMTWIALRYSGEDAQIVGIFSTEEKAVKACIDEYCLVGPLELDVDDNDSEESVFTAWDEAYYPHMGKKIQYDWKNEVWVGLPQENEV